MNFIRSLRNLTDEELGVLAKLCGGLTVLVAFALFLGTHTSILQLNIRALTAGVWFSGSWSSTGTLSATNNAYSDAQYYATSTTVYMFNGQGPGGWSSKVYSAPLSNLNSWTLAGDTGVAVGGARIIVATTTGGGINAGDVFLFGGKTATGFNTQIYKSNLSSLNTWTLAGALPVANGAYADMAMVYYGGYAYMFGGQGPGGWSCAVYRAQLTNLNSWSQVGTMTPGGSNYCPQEAGILVSGSDVYLFGGKTATGFYLGVYKANFSNLNSWSVVGTMPNVSGVYASAGVSVEYASTTNLVYLMGGEGAGGWWGNVFSASLSNLSSWTSVGTIAANYFPSAAGSFQYGGNMYILGGRYGGGFFNQIYKAPFINSTVPGLSLSINASPATITTGSASTISWSASGVKPGTCTVTGTGISWTDSTTPPANGSFHYTGANQTYTVPAGITSLWVRMWGAGGGRSGTGASQAGGAGGYTTGVIAVSPGQSYTVLVGRGGDWVTGGENYPGGGAGNGAGGIGGGGGRSAICLGTFTYKVGFYSCSGGDLLTAGGGGSGNTSGVGGSGGGSSGVAGGGNGGGGGTQSAGGAAGTGGGVAGAAYQGASGTGSFSASGGGGKYGGGASANSTGGGGGGSGYIGGAGVSNGTTLTGSGNTPSGTSESVYLSGIGLGSPSSGTSTIAGNNGFVSIVPGGGISSSQSTGALTTGSYTYTLSCQPMGGGTAVTASALVTVLPVMVSISSTADASASEGTPPTDTGTFTVSRTGSTASALTVNLTVPTDGTAVRGGSGDSTSSGKDYYISGNSLDGSNAAASTVTIPAGSASTNVTLTTINDILVEGSETAKLAIAPSVNYSVDISFATGTITISDDDTSGPLTVSFSPSSITASATSTASWEAPGTINGSSTIACSSGTCPTGGGSTNLTAWATEGTLPANSPLSGVPVLIGNYYYRFGGNLVSGYTNNIIRAVSGDLANWSIAGSMPAGAAVGNAPVAVVGNYVYLFGGYNGLTYSNTIYRAPLAGNAFLTSTNWVAAGTLPSGAPRAYQNFAIIGDKLYFFGGNNGSSWVNTIWSASVVDPLVWTQVDTGSLTNCANRSAGDGSVVIANGLAYLLGGILTSGAYTQQICSAPLSRVTENAAWINAGTLPTTNRGKITTALVGNTVYLMGGYNGATYTLGMYSAPVASTLSFSSFSTSPTPSSAPGLVSAIASGNKLYLLGGQFTSGSWNNVVYSASIAPATPFQAYMYPSWVTDNSFNAGVTWPVTSNQTFTLSSYFAGPTATSTSKTLTVTVPNPTLSILAGGLSAKTMEYGSSTSVSWTSANVQTSSCVVYRTTPTPFSTTTFATADSGNQTTGALSTAGDWKYTLACNKLDGSAANWAKVLVTVTNTTPQLVITNFSITPKIGVTAVNRVRKGSTIQLYWSVTGLTDTDTTTNCSISSSPSTAMTTRNWDHTGTTFTETNGGSAPSVVVNSATTFTLTCSNSNWATPVVSRTATVTIIPGVSEI